MTRNRTERWEYDEFENDYIEHEDRVKFNIRIIIFMTIIGVISMIIYTSFSTVPEILLEKSRESLADADEVDHRPTLRHALLLRKLEKRIFDLDEELNTLCSIARTTNIYNTTIKHKCHK